MGDLRRVGGSLLDGAAAAGVNFVAGLVALRTLSVSGIAIYALLSASAVLVGLLLQQSILTPQRTHVNRLQGVFRPEFRRDALATIAVAPVVLILIGLGGSALASELPLLEYASIAAWCSAWTLLFPFFAHIRASAHVADKSRAASISSSISLGIMMVGLVISQTASGPLSASYPFMILVVANLIGILACVSLLRRVPNAPIRERLTWAVVSGHSLSSVTTEAATFVIMLVAAVSLSVNQLAELEVARVAASPLFIVMGALSTGLLPAALRRFHSGHPLPLQIAVKRLQAAGAVITLIAPVAILLAAGLLSTLLGRSLDPTLGAVRTVANGLTGTASYVNAVQMSRRLYSSAARDALIAGVASILLMLTAVTSLGVYALPLALIGGALVRLMLGRGVARE